MCAYAWGMQVPCQLQGGYSPAIPFVLHHGSPNISLGQSCTAHIAQAHQMHFLVHAIQITFLLMHPFHAYDIGDLASQPHRWPIQQWIYGMMLPAHSCCALVMWKG